MTPSNHIGRNGVKFDGIIFKLRNLHNENTHNGSFLLEQQVHNSFNFFLIKAGISKLTSSFLLSSDKFLSSV